MIKKISVNRYRKLKSISFDFSKSVNLLSGTNGTCKTSILHLISNSFQTVTTSCDWLKESNCLETIKKINSVTNPKVESLTRGDKVYNDPAVGFKGTLFSIEYFGHSPLEFRRHNSLISNRYAVKPTYQKGSKDSLPFCPVIYLGLSRLLPFGEFKNDDAIQGIKRSLPTKYLDEISTIYKRFTGLSISYNGSQKMGDVKVRSDFNSDYEGIDSNTISAGEDNLFIILTALISLKYYFDSIESRNDIESILLIDELDATLHPSYQINLLHLFQIFTEHNKIQIFFTTHSMSLIEEALEKKENIIYLIDNITNVVKMDDPDIYKIKMHLHTKTYDDIYLNKKIPIFTEDAEARFFLEHLFDYFEKTQGNAFHSIRRLFHFVEVNIGSDNLVNIFNDSHLLRSTMRSICILDGDQQGQKNYSNCIIVLPGGDSPEWVLINFAINLFDNDSQFWQNQTILKLGYGKIQFRDNILPNFKSIDAELEKLKQEGKSTKGVKRSLSKKVFADNKRFLGLIIAEWLVSSENQQLINNFYRDLNIMFKKVAEFHGINPNDWNC